MTIVPPYKFAVFEVVLEKRYRKTMSVARVRNSGRVIMIGSERNRPAAKYHADKTLFQLFLTAPIWMPPPLSSFETSASQ